jgi:hypothetical protein
MRPFVLISILIFPLLGYGQISVDAGVDAGIPLVKNVQDLVLAPPFVPNAPVSSTGNIERPKFVIGPVVQLHLVREFSLETELLYRPVRFQVQRAGTNFTSTDSITAYSLELPVSGKFIFGSGRFRPTASAGFVVYDRLWGTVDSSEFIISSNLQTHVRSPYRPDDSSSGPPIVATAGIVFARSRFTLTPELRYTRWPGNLVRNQNQWDFILGFKTPVFRRH